MVIDLSFNQIKDLDLHLLFYDLNLFSCIRLLLDNNRIERIKQNDFIVFTELNKLDLSFNQINSIHSNSFLNLSFLESLSLSHNKIKYINGKLFENLLFLKHLNLSSNLMEYLEPNVFDNLEILIDLDLRNNKLKILTNEVFKYLNKLMNLYLENNLNLIISPQSLSYLESIQNIHMDLSVLSNETNKINIIRSFNLRTIRQLEGIKFYNSINFLYSEKNVDCKLTLFYTKQNLKINLKFEDQFFDFWEYCSNLRLK